MNSAQLRAVAQDVRGLFVTTILVAGCAGYAAVCTHYPCPIPEVGRIAVTATNAPIVNT